MKKLLNTLMFIFLAIPLINAQSSEQDTQPGEWITVNIDMTDSITKQVLGVDGLSKLESKVLRIVSEHSKHCKISCVKNSNVGLTKINLGELNTGIICKPKFEIFDEEKISTGMEKLTVVKVSLSVFIQSVQGNVVFASTSKEYAGTGKTKALAINNALVGISTKDISYRDFLKDARGEIVRYYNQMCDIIIEQATTLSKFKRHRDAILLLWPIPKEVKCREAARDTMLNIYKDFSEYNCRNFLFNAKTYITQKDYKLAMEELRKIDAVSKCAQDAIALMDQIASKVDEQERQYLDLYKKMRENEFELERERYRSIANMQKSINYTKVDIQDRQ
jgi:hypothetical protein